MCSVILLYDSNPVYSLVPSAYVSMTDSRRFIVLWRNPLLFPARDQTRQSNEIHIVPGRYQARDRASKRKGLTVDATSHPPLMSRGVSAVVTLVIRNPRSRYET